MRADRKFRIAAILLIAAVCFAMLFSACFVAATVHHDCDGAGCLICLQISTCENILRALTDAFPVSLALCAVLSLVARVDAVSESVKSVASLVTLRVELLD